MVRVKAAMKKTAQPKKKSPVRSPTKTMPKTTAAGSAPTVVRKLNVPRAAARRLAAAAGCRRVSQCCYNGTKDAVNNLVAIMVRKLAAISKLRGKTVRSTDVQLLLEVMGYNVLTA
eukprot:Rhum_TRINITY_DN18848_c0_g1::Rhum_TRINITY_DN18848_c0_g1_i1::g.168578::m.168578